MLREKAIFALLTEPSIVKAAAVVGVNEKTLRRWKQNEAFAQQLDEARRELYRQSINLCHSLQTEMVSILAEQARSSTSEAVRNSAARFLLEHGLTTYETFDLEQRLAALEVLQNERTP